MDPNLTLVKSLSTTDFDFKFYVRNNAIVNLDHIDENLINYLKDAISGRPGVHIPYDLLSQVFIRSPGVEHIQILNKEGTVLFVAVNSEE